MTKILWEILWLTADIDLNTKPILGVAGVASHLARDDGESAADNVCRPDAFASKLDSHRCHV